MIEHVSYKNYEIDVSKNINVYSTLLDLHDIFNKKNVPFLVGGSLALTLFYKKTYRTLKDIDLNVSPQIYPHLTKLFKEDLTLKRTTNSHCVFLYEKTGIEMDFATYLYSMRIDPKYKEVDFCDKKFYIVDPSIIWYFREQQNTKLLDFEDFDFYCQFDEKLVFKKHYFIKKGDELKTNSYTKEELIAKLN